MKRLLAVTILSLALPRATPAKQYSMYSRSRGPTNAPVSQEVHAELSLTCDRNAESMTFRIRDGHSQIWTKVNTDEARKMFSDQGVDPDDLSGKANLGQLTNMPMVCTFISGVPILDDASSLDKEIREYYKLVEFVFFPHIPRIRDTSQFQGLLLKRGTKTRLALNRGRTLDVYTFPADRESMSCTGHMFRIWKKDESIPVFASACASIGLEGMGTSTTEIDVVAEGNRIDDLRREVLQAISTNRHLKAITFLKPVWHEAGTETRTGLRPLPHASGSAGATEDPLDAQPDGSTVPSGAHGRAPAAP